ncbi:MAG TPA: DUF503 domain-containing protein [Arthrobacter sp.]|nr:DUF503 domain-containing protein [Arthrobacter sp.]
MWIGWIELDVLLGDVHSLKGKRSVVRPIISDVRRKYSVSAAEVDAQDLYRRTVIGAGLVAGSRAHAVEVLDAVEQFVAYRPELELLTARRRIITSDDA